MNDLSEASSCCPLCGIDTQHSHTKWEWTHKCRQAALQKEFEKGLPHWFIRHKDAIPGSYGMGIYLDKKAQNGIDTYWWWPVEMLWKEFQRGAYFVTPSLGRDEALRMHEALQIQADPFGKQETPKP